MAKRKLGVGTVIFYGLVGLITYFAAAFSMQGFLTLGADLASNIPIFPLLGWLMNLAGAGGSLRIAGFILTAWACVQAFNKKGLSVIDLLVLLLGLALIGGIKTLATNVGGILGFCLFAWFNAVQLSAWAGFLLGFDKNWAKKLQGHIAIAYLGEFIINLLRFPPYADGRWSTFAGDARYRVLDPSQINVENLLFLVCSIFAVEFTFVFFIKLVHEVNAQMKGRGQARQTQRDGEMP
ncbi:MAG: hypothetical protein ACR2FS_15155 [Phormidesmis sp.]